MSDTLFLNVKQITQVHGMDIFLSDIADVYCTNRDLENRCKAIKITNIRKMEKSSRYVGNVLDIIKKVEEINSSLQVNNVGEVDFIIAYEPPKPPNYLWQWLKTIFVCFVCFAGAAFAIMTFNNDVSVGDVFKEIYLAVTGTESDGFTVLEASYSVGLALGIIVFFNHFAKFQISKDPTPLEVEMRLYEDNINKTLIQNHGRKESGVDVT